MILFSIVSSILSYRPPTKFYLFTFSFPSRGYYFRLEPTTSTTSSFDGVHIVE